MILLIEFIAGIYWKTNILTTVVKNKKNKPDRIDIRNSNINLVIISVPKHNKNLTRHNLQNK